MPIKLANNASGTLATAINASDTGIALTTGDGAKFPALGVGDYFYATLTSPQGTQEIVKVTARSGDSLTVVRAQEGTTAAGFAVGARFELRVTAQSVRDAIDDVVASQVGFTPVGAISATDVQAALAELDTEKIAFTRIDDTDGSNLVGFLQSGTGAVSRTVQSKLRDVVSVKDFGAVGNGVANDSPAFQAALDSKASVFVPAGTYYLATPVTITDGATIFGEGYKKYSSGWGQGSVIKPATTAFVTVNPLDQKQQAQVTNLIFAGGTVQIDFGLFHGVQLEDCWFYGFTKAAFVLVRGEKHQFRNIRLDFTVDSQYGVGFGYEASTFYNSSTNTYAGQNVSTYFGTDDAWVDRLIFENIIFQSGATKTWKVAAVTCRLLSFCTFSTITFHGPARQPTNTGKIMVVNNRLQWCVMHSHVIDGMNKNNAPNATIGYDFGMVLSCIFYNIHTNASGTSNYTAAIKIGNFQRSTFINCSAQGNNTSTFGFYIADTTFGQRGAFIQCYGSLYYLPGQNSIDSINCIACEWTNTTQNGGIVELVPLSEDKVTYFMADVNGAALSTGRNVWRYVQGGSTFESASVTANGFRLPRSDLRYSLATQLGDQTIRTIYNASPEGAVAANPGSLVLRIDAGGATGKLFVKETGTGNTGWVQK